MGSIYCTGGSISCVTGRILAGLPINLLEFAAFYPDFIPIDVEQSLMSSVGWSCSFFAEASGLMPHHVQMNNEKRIEQKIDELPSKIEALLEDKQMNGTVSLSEMKKLAENSPPMRRVEQTIACMESILEMRMESN